MDEMMERLLVVALAVVVVSAAPVHSRIQNDLPSTLDSSRLRFGVRCDIAWLGAESTAIPNRNKDTRAVVGILDPAVALTYDDATAREILNRAASLAQLKCPEEGGFGLIRVAIRRGDPATFSADRFTARHSPGPLGLSIGVDSIQQLIFDTYPELVLEAFNGTNMEIVFPRPVPELSDISWVEYRNYDTEREIERQRIRRAEDERQQNLARQARTRAESEANLRRVGAFVALVIVAGIAILIAFGRTATRAPVSNGAALSYSHPYTSTDYDSGFCSDSSDSSLGQHSPRSAERNDPSGHRLPILGPSGNTVYAKTGWFSEETAGRIDDGGRTFKSTGAFSEDEVGRIDEHGNVYQTTGWLSEEQTHRIDDDGTIYKKTGWFSEERAGRIDEDGRIFEKRGWFSEEEVGRVEGKKDDNSCFISTACVRVAGLRDDSEPLQVLRAFRDEYVLEQANGQKLIDEYYKLARTILARIDASDRSEQWYRYLFVELVLRSVDLIKQGRNEDALRNYSAVVVALTTQSLHQDPPSPQRGLR